MAKIGEPQGNHIHVISSPTLVQEYCDICGKPFRKISGEVAEGDVWTASCTLNPPRFSLEQGRRIITYFCHRECAEYLNKHLPDKLAELFSQWTNIES